MIIKAEIKRKPIQSLDSLTKRSIPKDKRYLICINSDDESKVGYVFDLHEQRIVYKVIPKRDKTIEDVFKDIYGSFKRSETRIVDHNIILNAIIEIPDKKKQNTTLSASIRIQEEARVIGRLPISESIHIKKIKETYKYIDKYKVKLPNIEIKKIGEDQAEVHLFDSLNGIEKGVHILKYDYNKGVYSYYYGPKLIVKSFELEDIFK